MWETQLLIFIYKDTKQPYAAAAKKHPLWVEKTNKSELRNRLTYRVLIYIFEVRMKTFFPKWEISRSKSQFKKIKK